MTHWYDSQPTELDRAYYERNALVAALSKLWPSHLAMHGSADTSWDPEWRHIVFVNAPVGQLSWHIHDSQLPLFSHLSLGPNEYDGHTTVEKYERLATL